MKKTIRLSESELHRVIKESVKRALSEGEAWANQPPIDEFHPDWWYYRQEVEPKGLEDFDPCMDLSDEEYDERLRQEFGENDLHRIVKESIRRILKEEYEPYKWDGLDDDRKEFEKHLSWRNKEEVDANDKAITNPLSYMNKQDSDRVGQMIQANRTSKPGAKMSWDWGYKSGRGVDDPTDVKTVSDFEKAEDEFVNPYDSKYWHNYALRDEFWDGIPESRTLNTKSTIRLSESDLHRVIKESVRRILKEGNDPLGWNYGGGYQVCIFQTRNGGMKASVIEIGSPVIEDALQVCYTGTLEDCEAKAEKWNAKNYWNR